MAVSLSLPVTTGGPLVFLLEVSSTGSSGRSSGAFQSRVAVYLLDLGREEEGERRRSLLNRGGVWGARVFEGVRGVERFALFRWWAVQRFENSLPDNTKISLHYMVILCTFRRKHA